MQNPFFWHQIPKPLIGLAPMDGVTDITFRNLVCHFSKPDLIFTEFVNVDALMKGAWQQLEPLRFDPRYRPIIAQVYGSEPEHFYQIAHLIGEMGFDGIDINMGCPAKKIAKRGAGAGLILDPPRAQEIIRKTRQGITDWANGQKIEQLSLPSKVLKKFPFYQSLPAATEAIIEKKILPVSVKTRLGVDRIIIQDWVKTLLETEPVAISIHGRTLDQMYQGEANWEMIQAATEIIHQTNTLAMGNGDLRNITDWIKRIQQTKVDGILIGRNAIGKPWLFNSMLEVKKYLQESNLQSPQEKDLNPKEVIEVMKKHLQFIKEIDGEQRTLKMFRHIRKYGKNLPIELSTQNQIFSSKSYQEFKYHLDKWEQEIT